MVDHIDMENAWSDFIRCLDKIKTEYVPTIKIKPNERPKWMSRELLQLVRKKKRAWKTFRSQGTAVNLETYKTLEKDVVKKVRNAKRRMEKEISKNEDRNNKKFTNYIRSKTKSKQSIGPIKNEEGKLLTDDLELAQELNNAFSKVFTKEIKVQYQD